MDLQCIQASGLKSTSVPNVRGDFHIYITRQSARHKCQNDILYGNMNIDFFAYTFKFKFIFKNTCSTMTVDCLDSSWSIVVKKSNDIPSQTGLSDYLS